MGRRRAVACAVLAVATAGCAVPRAAIGPEGRLEVLDPEPGFSVARLPADWAADGGVPAPDRAVLIERDGVLALRIVGGGAPFALVRRSDAPLLAAPYLAWAWNVQAHASGLHPVRLVIGFQGGAPGSGSWGAQFLQWLGTSLAPYDRLLTIGWGESALQRGSFAEVPAPTERLRHYVQRGGRENAGRWWAETIDIAEIYAAAWPDDDPGRTRIMFIGVAATEAPTRAVADIAAVILFR